MTSNNSFGNFRKEGGGGNQESEVLCVIITKFLFEPELVRCVRTVHDARKCIYVKSLGPHCIVTKQESLNINSTPVSKDNQTTIRRAESGLFQLLNHAYILSDLYTVSVNQPDA